MSSTTMDCGNGGGADTYTSLRIASVFIILVTSATGTFFPVLAKRSKWLKVPTGLFELVFFSFFSAYTILILWVALLNTSVLVLL